MNTVKKFLDATGFDRGSNYPSVTTLKAKMCELEVTEEAQIDVMSFFLYDHESTDGHEPVIKHFQDDSDRDSLDDWEGTIKHFQD